jgi:hypothetical protein
MHLICEKFSARLKYCSVSKPAKKRSLLISWHLWGKTWTETIFVHVKLKFNINIGQLFEETLEMISLSKTHAKEYFFANYTIHRRHSQRTHTHPYEYTHANPTPRSIFEDCAGKSSRLTKSPQTPRCRRERRLPLKAQTPLNPEKFAPTGSRTQDLRCYRGSCNH